MPRVVFVHGMNANDKSWNGLESHSEITRNWPDIRVAKLAGHDEPALEGPTLPDPSTMLGCIKFVAALARGTTTDPEMKDYVASVVAEFPPAPATGAGDVCLIGHSMGGAVISHVAAQYPGRVGLLIYLSAMFPSDDDSIGELSRQIAVTGPVLPRAICSEFGAFMPGIAQGLVRQPDGPKDAEFKSTDQFKKIPKHYIQCTLDKIIPPNAQEKMLKDHPTVVRHPLATGHLPQYQSKNKLAKLVASILKTWK